jgi:Family of unknown function (DUF6516)
MKAISIMRERISLDDDSFVELVVWKLPKPLAGSAHDFKYRLALVSHDVCVRRYDNEAGKGDHKHVGEVESNYTFRGLEQLQRDFWDDVEQWRQR